MNKPLFLCPVTVAVVLALALTACVPPEVPPGQTGEPATEEPEGGDSTPTPECLMECVGFRDQTPGSIYHVNDVFQDSGATLVVQEFDWGGGTMTSDGEASVHDQSEGYMEGNQETPYLWTNNVNIDFMFGCPLDGLSFRYAYWGGSINTSVNGDMQDFSIFSDIHGQQLGGVDVTVAVDPAVSSGHEEGVVTLEGRIDSFSVGGQELAIDDVCPK